jgi:hypothetical protein
MGAISIPLYATKRIPIERIAERISFDTRENGMRERY